MNDSQISGKLRLWHGGFPGLRLGGLIEPGHERQALDGCAYCEARAKGQTHNGIDGPSEHPGRVYLTTEREYARYHASLYGRGDLYRVEPIGELERSTEDTIPTWHAPAARVIGIYDRAVLLTWSQRRRLNRLWSEADRLAVTK